MRVVCCCLLILIAGCSGGTTAKTGTGERTAAKAPAPPALAEIKPVTFTQYEETLKPLRGKVVVIDFWRFD